LLGYNSELVRSLKAKLVFKGKSEKKKHREDKAFKHSCEFEMAEIQGTSKPIVKTDLVSVLAEARFHCKYKGAVL